MSLIITVRGSGMIPIMNVSAPRTHILVDQDMLDRLLDGGWDVDIHVPDWGSSPDHNRELTEINKGERLYFTDEVLDLDNMDTVTAEFVRSLKTLHQVIEIGRAAEVHIPEGSTRLGAQQVLLDAIAEASEDVVEEPVPEEEPEPCC